MINNIPEIETPLRQKTIKIPEVIQQVGGIKILGKIIKSLVFSTDIAIIRNINVNAVLAVYPFTPQPIITHALISASDLPVFTGVGGGMTQGKRVVNLALDAEFQGSMGVVLNAGIKNDIIKAVRSTIDIPIVVTIVSQNEDVKSRLDAGVNILNVSGGAKTPELVKKIREKFKDVPIIATGGPNDESIIRTIEAGANAISYTPPTTGEIFRELMVKYREQKDNNIL